MKMASLYELSSKNLPNLFWTPIIPQMLFPIYDNLSLPKLYTTEYFGIVYNRLRKVRNPYTDFMKPTNYPDEIHQYIKSRWIPPGSDTMLMFKDITIQQKIDTVLCQQWESYTYKQQNIFKHEAEPKPGESDFLRCDVCLDSDPHTSSKDLCVYKAHVQRYPDAIWSEFKCIEFSSIAAFWISVAGYVTEYVPHTVVDILNLSSSNKKMMIHTGYSFGNRCVLRARGTHLFRFSCYREYLERVLSALPAQTHAPVFINTIYEQEHLESEYQMMTMAHAFVEQIQRLRAKYGLTIIILGPISSYNRTMNRAIYEAERKKLQFFSHIIGLTCRKCCVTYVPLIGNVCSAYSIALGWSNVEEAKPNLDEKLFNLTGTPTRELRKRIGRLVEQILLIVRDVNLDPTHDTIYRRNTTQANRDFYIRYE
jgi:hypothetical protein